MSQETEAALRRSLDAIDSIRRRVFACGWLVVVVTLGAYAYLTYVQRTSHSLERIIGASVLALTCLIAWAAFSIILVVVRTTKMILRAIDLASQGSPSRGA